MRKLQDFESPYISLKSVNTSGTYRILLRKALVSLLIVFFAAYQLWLGIQSRGSKGEPAQPALKNSADWLTEPDSPSDLSHDYEFQLRNLEYLGVSN